MKKLAHCLKCQPLELIEGDGIAILPDIVPSVSQDSTLCIFHTHVANQISAEAKKKLSEQVRLIGTKLDVYHLYNNMWDLDLHLDYYVNGNEYSETIAETDGHGRWIKWRI